MSEQPRPQAFLQKLRKRRIIGTLAAFIAGGWLLIEIEVRLLYVYPFPEQPINLTVISVVGALLATLVWRWFRSPERSRGNVKVEILLVPLIILATTAIDLNIILLIAGISSKALLTGVIAFILGVAWVILKMSQWDCR